jgi:hypothetical protein
LTVKICGLSEDKKTTATNPNPDDYQEVTVVFKITLYLLAENVSTVTTLILPVNLLSASL